MGRINLNNSYYISKSIRKLLKEQNMSIKKELLQELTEQQLKNLAESKGIKLSLIKYKRSTTLTGVKKTK